MKTMIVILFNDENQKYDEKQFEFIIRRRKNRKQSLAIIGNHWAIIDNLGNEKFSFFSLEKNTINEA